MRYRNLSRESHFLLKMLCNIKKTLTQNLSKQNRITKSRKSEEYYSESSLFVFFVIL